MIGCEDEDCLISCVLVRTSARGTLHAYTDNELSTHTVKWNVCVVVCVLLQVGKLPTVTLRQLVGCNLTCERQIYAV